MSIIALHKPQTEQELSTRVLSTLDAEAYKKIRLEALRVDGQYFSASLETEMKRTLPEWQAACSETTKRAVFGTFCGADLIGTVAATQWDKDSTGNTVRWGAAYVNHKFRRMGVGESLYKLREEWCKARGFTKAVFSIREGNIRSIEIHEKQGAKIIGDEPQRYTDGAVVKTFWFERKLMP